MIIFLKHIDIEGPDTFSRFFEDKGFDVKVIDLQDGGPLPKNFKSIEAIISLGGPMNVYEEDEHPFLKDEHVFLREIIARKVPFIGICLGSQLLAKACDAKVGKSPEKEIGFLPVQLTPEGKRDPLFAGLNERMNLFHWHEDMSQLPPGATLLAFSQGCPHQAFKIGSNAYGLQFHIEVTGPTIKKWADEYFPSNDSFRMHQKRVMMDDYDNKKELFHQIADTVYNNFLQIISNHKSSRS
jgi:GMP synthase-like glutamine amidotransferase